jgi:hypothetical protein
MKKKSEFENLKTPSIELFQMREEKEGGGESMQ